MNFDVIVIGAGVVGAFIARKLSFYNLKVAILEKENDVGNVTSMANSAIIHSGYDPVPGSLKARFNVLGNRMFKSLCEKLDVHFVECGSLTLAMSKEEDEILKKLKIRSELNGVEVSLINKEDLLKIEPNISQNVTSALLAPTAGIVDVFNLTSHTVENALDNGAELFLNEEVINIIPSTDYLKVITKKNEYYGKVVINSAGLHSDEIAKLLGNEDYFITSRKGQYFILDHFKKGFVNHTLFPLPSSKGKGILFSPTSSGNYIVGPSSELCEDKDDFSTDALTLDAVKKQVLDMVPNIPFNESIRVFSGNRATPSKHDFIIEHSKYDKRLINLVGIESPGLTSAPAIADYVVFDMVSSLIPLNINPNAKDYIKKYISIKDLDVEQINELIKKDPDFGVTVCNCEKVTLGEIKQLFSRSIKPRSIKAVKKRTRAGFGKCQGGFCTPIVLKLLAKELKVSPLDIVYDKEDSNILDSEMKERK